MSKSQLLPVWTETIVGEPIKERPVGLLARMKPAGWPITLAGQGAYRGDFSFSESGLCGRRSGNYSAANIDAINSRRVIYGWAVIQPRPRRSGISRSFSDGCHRNCRTQRTGLTPRQTASMMCDSSSNARPSGVPHHPCFGGNDANVGMECE